MRSKSREREREGWAKFPASGTSGISGSQRSAHRATRHATGTARSSATRRPRSFLGLLLQRDRDQPADRLAARWHARQPATPMVDRERHLIGQAKKNTAG